MTNLTATATRVRKTKNESITYGDVVVRKAVEIGKYNYLCLFFWNGATVPQIGACKSAESASKYTPHQTSIDLYAVRVSEDDHTRAIAINHYRDLKAKYGAPKKMHRHGVTWYRFTVPFTRNVVRIERV